jgi:Ca2+-binding RTX toxin-like protein
VPVDGQTGAPLTPDADLVVGGTPAPGTYDNELLDAHYMAGDGRVNENIGLTAVHAIFHSEHNRLVEQTKETVRAQLAAGDTAFAQEWVVAGANLADGIQDGEWNGERLFQTAKFGTEMQYQHLVFEEFARTIQPNIDLFFAPTQVYDTNLDASIVAEFAHTVYRFGHSMLTETIDRLDPNFASSEIGLITAFLNPLAFAASGPTPDQAVGAIVRGLTRQVGQEIDEFVTEAVRNSLLGLPLDLPAINLARGRDAGIPSLNAVRRDIYSHTGDGQLKPYTSWADLVQHLKHPESVINFIAAYGTHDTITAATTLADKRAAASLLVFGGVGEPADRLDFLNSTGAFTSGADGVTITGVDAIDLWIGGLAEEKTPFGGMLGSTFNFVFENQLEKLQDGDRFYYLERTAGLAFNAELEGNSFAKLIMANTDATHLPALVFSTPTFILEVDQTKQFNKSVIAGPDGILLDNPATPVNEAADNLPGNADPLGGVLLTPLVIRDNPNTVLPDSNYLQYTGEDHIVMGGTAGNDILISSIGDDTVWGDAGNDRIDGGYGNDQLRGGAGDDIITDLGGDDNIQGGDGNDVIHGGNGINLLIGGFGSDFIITGEDSSEAIGGQGNDFILGSKANEQDMGNEGDDWLEKGTSDGAPGDNFDPLGNDPIIGNDVFIGDGENDKFNAEGGDDIMIGKVGFGDRYIGGSGYDWADFKDSTSGVFIDISNRFFDQPVMPSSATPLIRFDIVEGISGSAAADVLKGDNVDAVALRIAGATGSVLTNVGLINGMQDFLNSMLGTPTVPVVTFYDGGNIILGGDDGDIIEGRGGDDLIDGDKWLNVRISVREGSDAVTGLPLGAEIATFDSMTNQTLQHNMLNGIWNPGQLQIVRELLTAPGPDFDTAVFTGNWAEYTIATDVNGVTTVTDSVAGRDGSDHLANIERLQFADQAIVLGGLNAAPVGALTLSDSTPAVGQVLTVSSANVTDANNTATGGALTGPMSYFWQVERVTGSGIFEDITTFAAGEVMRAAGPSFTVTPDLNGLALRVKGIYKDGNDVLETVFSGPTALTTPAGTGTVNIPGTAAISDTTPTEGAALTATVTDPDGTATSVIALQWQAGGPGMLFTDIAGATSASFTPTQAEVGQQLRVRASYVDALGNPELLTSAATGGTGDLMIGTPAPDTLSGTAFDDNLQGLGDNDILNGFAGSDLLEGGDGDDSLTGGSGFDTMMGGTGNDSYEVTDAGDVVTEAVGEGIDTIWTSVNYALINTSEVENLFYGGTGNFTGSGNDGDNQIVGRAGNDVLNGGGGNDTLNGEGGNDILNGGAGGDTLNGGTGIDSLTGGSGADAMFGGTGNDSYEVTETVDVVQENTGQGIDTVWTSVNYALSNTSAVENLFYGGQGDFIGSGNDLDNQIAGGAGNDFLNGGGGNDILNGGAGGDTLNGGAGNDSLTGGSGADAMFGGTGDDSYEVTEAVDVVQENTGEGIDTIWTSVNYALSNTSEVENLFYGGLGNFTGSGNDGNNQIVGRAGNDTLNGAGGNDILIGGAGADTLTGGIGADTFVLTALGDSGVGAGLRDIITDFVSGTDKIDFSGIDANTGVAGNQAFTMIGTGAFFGVAGQLRYDVVGADTVMQGDVNGDGVADFELQLTGIHSFVPADLLL